MLFLVLAWLQNYTNLLANARRKSQEPGTSERDEQEYACFIVSLLLTIGSSPPRACSVTVSYKPPMLVTRVRLPACASLSEWFAKSVCWLHIWWQRHDIIFVLGTHLSSVFGRGTPFLMALHVGFVNRGQRGQWTSNSPPWDYKWDPRATNCALAALKILLRLDFMTSLVLPKPSSAKLMQNRAWRAQTYLMSGASPQNRKPKCASLRLLKQYWFCPAFAPQMVMHQLRSATTFRLLANDIRRSINCFRWLHMDWFSICCFQLRAVIGCLV